MNVGFFIFGGVIFAIYMYLTIWNIIYSSKKQRAENYPTIAKEKETKLEKRLDAIFIKDENNGKR